jgi:hypothetical protein
VAWVIQVPSCRGDETSCTLSRDFNPDSIEVGLVNLGWNPD